MRGKFLLTAAATVLAMLWITAQSNAQNEGQADESQAESTLSSAFNVTETFSPNTVTISTSEGAPHANCNFWSQKAAKCFNESNFGYGPTKVLHVYICLSEEVSTADCSQQPAVTGPLSAAMLKDIDAGLATYEGSGIRLILRFTYNFGPIGPNAMDAPIDVISQHIDQLAPVVIRHKDLILALEAGFIGTWGEWHDSTNGNDTAAAQKIVLDRELMHFRGLFPILVRYPGDYIQYMGGLHVNPALGLHDDHYASDAVDGATWRPCYLHGGYCFTDYTQDQFMTFAAEVSAKTMFVAEFGALYPTLQTCDALNEYSYEFHLQSVALEPFPATIGTFLQNEGCALSFYNKVGTRIVLQKAKLAGNPMPGGRLCVELTLVNDGYGRVIREHPVSVVLRQNGTDVATIPIPTGKLDLRTLESSLTEVPKTFHFELTLPKNIAAGTTTMTLLFRDPEPTLANQAEYALPLNSVDQQGNPIFEPGTGHNRIATFDIN
jgi:hypothetical protein